MTFLKRLFTALTVIWLAGCATPEPPADVPAEPKPRDGPVASQGDLVKSLGLQRPREELGAIEKTFNSCQLTPNAEPCTTRYVTLVHFQLLCRDSEGTVSDAPVDLRPLMSDEVKWNSQAYNGVSRTDERGYGEIIALSDKSLLQAHVTLRMGTHFLGLTLGEMSKVVLPNNFCPSAR